MDRQAPDNWFEDVYAGGDIDGKDIPWAALAPAPLLVSWLDRAHPTGHGEFGTTEMGQDSVSDIKRGLARWTIGNHNRRCKWRDHINFG